MSKGKDLTTAEKEKITKLLNEGISTLEVSKELYRVHQMIKKTMLKI